MKVKQLIYANLEFNFRISTKQSHATTWFQAFANKQEKINNTIMTRLDPIENRLNNLVKKNNHTMYGI